MPLVLVSITIFLSYHFLLTRLGKEEGHQRYIFSGLFLFAQIILTQLFLGILGWLYLSSVIWLNIAVGLTVILIARRFPTTVLQKRAKSQNVVSTENIILLFFLSFLILWMVGAIYFLPPRCSDDRAYHVTPIYEYIINHRIFLLPVEFYPYFSMPENAELLFMWPAIFFHSQQFVDSIQFIMALWGMIVLYGLARALNVLPKIALFISLLFIFSPIVMAQMGSNYIDIITAVFFLTTLYCAVMFYQKQQAFYLYSTFLAAGLLIGMKYNQLFLLIVLIPFLWSRRRSIKPRQWIYCGAIFCLCGGYWYLRNFLILHTPIFTPSRMTWYIELFPQPGHIIKKLEYLWHDIGLGTLHGGYGVIFWGLAVPAWVYVLINAWRSRKNEGNKIVLWLGLAFILGVGQLMLVTLEDFKYEPRYSLFIITLGLVALGQTLTAFNQFVFFRRTIQWICIFFAFLSFLHLGGNAYPGYQIAKPLKNFLRHEPFTEQFYAPYTFPKRNSSQEAFALMDYLTINDPRGMSCYVVGGYKPLTAALYGTKLQNRVWNFQAKEDRPILPDAILYFGPSADTMNYYGGPIITPEEAKAHPDYILMVKNSQVLFFMRRDFLLLPDKQQRLTDFKKIILKGNESQ